MKTCSKCSTAKPFSEYYRHAQSKDGFRPDCKACRNLAYKRRMKALEDRRIDGERIAIKRCNACSETKPVTAFSKCIGEADGYQTSCKECIKIKSSERIQQNKERWLSNPSPSADKKCNACRLVKKSTDFNKSLSAYDGLQGYCRDCASRYQKDNPEIAKKKRRKHRTVNYEKVRAFEKSYAKVHAHRYRGYVAKRRAAVRLATMKWADMKKVSEFYFAADFLGMVTGEWYHVDHIVPILGPIQKTGPFQGERLVTGLHVEANLQVLLGKENNSKKNFYWPDMP